MATVPKGPGQTEVTGDLASPRSPSQPGLYRDPQSGAESEVTMPSGADALVRMGWELVDPNERKDMNDNVAPENDAAAPQDPKLDDADAVQDQQDNAPGHKSEVIDGPAGVPAGDPEKLADKADADTDKA